mgnify:CR=1 FL=1
MCRISGERMDRIRFVDMFHVPSPKTEAHDKRRCVSKPTGVALEVAPAPTLNAVMRA